MICEHLQPILESEMDTGLLCHVATLQVLRMGRLAALKKSQGWVRGIVVSDVFRRVIARTIAKQCAVAAEKAAVPFQYALRTRAGCECVSHVMQTLTGFDATTTILSQDGVEVVDHGRWRPSSEALLWRSVRFLVRVAPIRWVSSTCDENRSILLERRFQAALRVALGEISTGQERGDEQRQERGWKLFFLLPRMLLSRPCRGGLVPRKKLEAPAGSRSSPQDNGSH